MMKRFLPFLVAIMGLLAIYSCQKDDSGKNSLSGTKWTATYSDLLMVLEFTSSSDVIGYFAKENGTYYTGMTNGKYKVSGDRITFTNLTFRYAYAGYELESGSINGPLLTANGVYSMNVDKGNWSSWSKTFNRQ